MGGLILNETDTFLQCDNCSAVSIITAEAVDYNDTTCVLLDGTTCGNLVEITKAEAEEAL